MHAQYGTPLGGNVMGVPIKEKPGLLFPQRKRLNLLSVLVAFFVPWILAVSICTVLSFSIHEDQPWLCLTFVALCLFLTFVVGFLAHRAKQNGHSSHGQQEPTWLIFLFVSMLIAWGFGVVWGYRDYVSFAKPFYKLTQLNIYPDVDPSQMRGLQLMDAGIVTFTEGTHLDLKKSMGFKRRHTYCVVPITRHNRSLATYDFWAVGVDCCGGSTSSFHCKNFNSQVARSGLRIMDEVERTFYWHAVGQAESAYNIKALYPLFFTWVHDPTKEMKVLKDEASNDYIIGVFVHFLFQASIVVFAVFTFSKM